MKLPDPVQMAVPFFILLIIIEMVAVKRGARGAYDWRDSAASLTMGMGSTLAGLLSAGIVVALAYWF